MLVCQSLKTDKKTQNKYQHTTTVKHCEPTVCTNTSYQPSLLLSEQLLVCAVGAKGTTHASEQNAEKIMYANRIMSRSEGQVSIP